MQNDGLAQINELWLFRGTTEQKTYKAEFVGVKTRDELIRDYGYLSWEGRASSRPNAGGTNHSDEQQQLNCHAYCGNFGEQGVA